MIRGFLWAYFLWCLSSLGFARPLDTDDTGTVARGKWEVEGGVDYLRIDGAEAWALTPVLAYGVNNRLQFDLGCDYLVESIDSNDSDIRVLKPSVQFKYRWWNSTDGRLSFALKGNVCWPVQQRDNDLKRHGHIRLLATRVFAAAEIDFNAGYDFTGAWGGGDDDWIVSVGVRRTIAPSLVWVGEVFATIPERGGAVQCLAATGAKLEGRNGWTFDALVGVGIGRHSPEVRVVLGFVRSI